jgi:hypothetical protein
MRLVTNTAEGRTENPRVVRTGEPVALVVPVSPSARSGAVLDVVATRPDGQTRLQGMRRLDGLRGGDCEIALTPFDSPGEHVLWVELDGTPASPRLRVDVVGSPGGRSTSARRRYKGRG